MITQILARLRRYPTQIANGLLIHKVLLLLRNVGIVIEPYYFYQEGPFRSEPPEGRGGFTDFEFVECDMASFGEIASFYPVPPTPDELRARFGDGQRCFGLTQGGRIAAFSWCETARISFTPCARPLEKNEAYLFGAETRYEFRGRRLQPHLRRRCYDALRADGRHLVYSYSDYFNYPAIHFKKKLGARVLFSGMNIELFGLWKKSWIMNRKTDVIDPPGIGAGKE